MLGAEIVKQLANRKHAFPTILAFAHEPAVRKCLVSSICTANFCCFTVNCLDFHC